VSQQNKPNVVLPLAISYNQRNNAGYSAATSGFDQRKVNCMYELATNALTGKQTLHLVKRPGPDTNSTDYSSSGAVGYLVAQGPFNATPETTPWLFWKSSGNVIQVNSNAIVTAAAFIPAYVDATYISGTSTVILQIRDDHLTAQRVFYASAINSWTEITDSNFTSLIHRGKMEHLDGWAFILTSTNDIYNSAINSVSSWPAANKIKKQIQQDVASGLAKFKNQILAFGNESVEVFVNAGNATGSPLRSIPELQARVGLGAPAAMWDNSLQGHTHYYCTVGNKMYFLGRRVPSAFVNAQGVNSNELWSYDGQRFEKVSNDYADKLLMNTNDVVGPYSVNAFKVNGKVAVAIQMTTPATTAQRWLMYFPEWNDWFEWESSHMGPVNCGDWFLKGGSGVARATAFKTTPNTWADNGNNFTMTVQFRMPGEDGSRYFMSSYGVVGDTDSTTNNLAVSYSDDDDATFSTARNIDMTQQRKLLFRGGAYQKRTFRLESANARPVRLAEFVATVK